MKRLEQIKRGRNGPRASISQLGPTAFLIGEDSWPVLGQAETNTGIRIHVAIGHVVNQLPDRPSSRTIRCLELLLGKSGHCGSQVLWQLPNAFNGRAALLRREGIGSRGITDWVAQVSEFSGFRSHQRFGLS